MSSEQQFIAQVSQLRLDAAVAIDSVSPAPGQSEHANTLPHVVLKNAELPWERPFSSASIDSFNKMPWICLLTFTEDELEVPTEYLRKWKMTPHQGVTYTSSMKAGDLREPKASGLLSPVQKMEGNFKDNDMVDCLMVKADLFKKLFGSYENGASASSFNGKPDVGVFAHLAHIRSTHSNTTTSASLEDTESKVSLLMGHRVAPIGLEQPTTMISHVVSLEGIDKLEFSDDSTEYIGLVSLHSWTWTALPPSDVDFVGTMENLGKSIQPLRTKSEVLDPLKKREPVNENALWVYKQLQDGYSLKPYMALTGEATTALFRGPFTPTFPTRMRTFARTWSTSGTDLAIVDPKTGIVNVSYQSAWQLGRQLGTSDATFSMSLLRLRSRMAADASKQVRAKAYPDFVRISESNSQLSSAASNVVEAEKSDQVQVGKINSTLPWGDGWPHFLNASLDTGPKISQGMSTPQYYEQIENMAPILTRARGSANIHQSPYNQGSDTNSHDWANVLPWITDVLLVNKIPLQYLIPDLESLPQESIRAFFVDPIWLECVVDGALSLAYHFEPRDIPIKREFKSHINEFLRTPQDTLDGKTPRLPKWGFFIRSNAISSFPDLRVEGLIRSDDKSDQSEIFLTRRISDDVIVCLTNRIPGEMSFTKLLISQPGNQQGFAFGNTIDDKQVSLTFKRFPTKSGAAFAPGDRDIARTWNRDRKDGEPLPIFDWDARTVILTEFAKQCLDALRTSGSSEWDNECPSLIVSSQLSQADLRLEIDLTLEPDLQQRLTDPAQNPWVTKDGFRQIHVPDASDL